MKKKDPIETLRNPAPGVHLVSFEFRKRCQVCEKHTHAKYHEFTQAQLNPIALIEFIERHTQAAPLVCASIKNYIYAVTGMDAAAVRAELAREAAQASGQPPSVDAVDPSEDSNTGTPSTRDSESSS